MTFDEIRDLTKVTSEEASQAFQTMSTLVGKTADELCESVNLFLKMQASRCFKSVFCRDQRQN